MIPTTPNHRVTGVRRFRRSEGIYLALAVGLGAIPLLALCRTEMIGYDAFWHVFVARQDVWSNFWEEVGSTAHPPLFYLCLKAAIGLLGNNAVSYRAVSILATLGSSWLVARIVRRISDSRWLPPIAACAFGLSLTTVSIGLDVRAYALSVFFLLGASLAYLDLVHGAFAGHLRPARIRFGVMTVLALATHYAAAFFLAATLVVPLALAVVNSDYRRRLREGILGYRLANAVTFAVPLAVLAAGYFVQMRFSDLYTGHVTSFLYAQGRESAPAFVLRNTNALFELFLPSPFRGEPASTLVAADPRFAAGRFGLLALLTAALGWLTLRLHRGTFSIVSSVPLVLLLAMWLLLIAAGLLGRYPYGGELRHQFFIFPFMVIVLALLIDQLHAWLHGRKWRGLIVGLFALAVFLNTAIWTTHFRVARGYLWQPKMDAFRQLVPAPEAVYVDGFNIITLFVHHHNWRWQFVGRNRGESQDLWHVANGVNAFFYVCRDTTRSLLDFSEDATYQRLAACLAATGARQVAVFRPQPENNQVPWRLEQTGTILEDGARRAGLAAESMSVVGSDVYAAFARSRGSPAVNGPSEAESWIEVVQATYGSNCGADRGNATRDVRRACDRMANCDYQVDVTRLGDPAPGCPKQFEVDYRCSGGDSARRVTLPAEAGLSGTATLRCR